MIDCGETHGIAQPAQLAQPAWMGWLKLGPIWTYPDPQTRDSLQDAMQVASQASQQPGSAPAHAAARGSWGSRPCTPWALHLTGVISHWNDQSPALSLSPILSLNTLLARFLAIHSFTLTFDLASQPSPDLTALQSSLACPLLSCSRSRRTRRPTHFHVQTFLHSALLQASNMTWR